MNEAISINPPIPWERARRRPELNGHLTNARIIRIVGPQDRSPDDGYPWDDKATKGPVDQVRVAYWVSPEPEGWVERIVGELQRLVNAFPDHEITGWLDLHDEDSPLEKHRRV